MNFQFLRISIQILLLLHFLHLARCGSGAPELSHTGYCEGYSAWATSDYVLPWLAGSSFAISQGNCGPASHLGDQRYAYDVAMDIGTPIVAARAGTVIEVVESNSDGSGCSGANYIKVRHSDNTVALYLHLTKDGSDVALGESVAQGAVIGRSGNTGCSSSPHLHFMVTADNGTKSLPITFRNTSTNIRGLQSGKTYLAN